MSKNITLYIFSRWSSGALWRLILFYWAFLETVAKSRTDEIYKWRLRIASVRQCISVARSTLR